MFLIAISFFKIQSAETEVPITGAFGFELGKIYRLAPQKFTMFHPVKNISKKFRKFKKYDISVNDEQKIFLIRAEYYADSPEEAQEELKIIEKAMETKYKVKPTPIKTTQKRDFYFNEITNKDPKRTIAIVQDQNVIRIMYRDHELGKAQAKNLSKEISKEDLEAI